MGEEEGGDQKKNIDVLEQRKLQPARKFLKRSSAAASQFYLCQIARSYLLKTHFLEICLSNDLWWALLVNHHLFRTSKVDGHSPNQVRAASSMTQRSIRAIGYRGRGLNFCALVFCLDCSCGRGSSGHGAPSRDVVAILLPSIRPESFTKNQLDNWSRTRTNTSVARWDTLSCCCVFRVL